MKKSGPVPVIVWFAVVAVSTKVPLPVDVILKVPRFQAIALGVVLAILISPAIFKSFPKVTVAVELAALVNLRFPYV